MTTTTETEALTAAELARQMLAHLDECNRIGKFSSIEEVHIRQICEALSTPVADPETLPCDVMLPPATTIRAGCGMDTLRFAMSVPGRPRHFATPADRMLAGEGQAVAPKVMLSLVQARGVVDAIVEHCRGGDFSCDMKAATKDVMRLVNVAMRLCRHQANPSMGQPQRQDLQAWQDAQSEYFDDTIIGIVTEYAEWRDAHPPAAEPVGLRELLDRAELAWQRFFYPAADNFTGPIGDKLPSVDLEVADCLRLVLAAMGRHVVTPSKDIPAVKPLRDAQVKTVAEKLAAFTGAPYEDWRHFTVEAGHIIDRLSALATPARTDDAGVGGDFPREKIARLCLSAIFGFEYQGESLCDEAERIFCEPNPRAVRAVAVADQIAAALSAHAGSEGE